MPGGGVRRIEYRDGTQRTPRRTQSARREFVMIVLYLTQYALRLRTEVLRHTGATSLCTLCRKKDRIRKGFSGINWLHCKYLCFLRCCFDISTTEACAHIIKFVSIVQ